MGTEGPIHRVSLLNDVLPPASDSRVALENCMSIGGRKNDGGVAATAARTVGSRTVSFVVAVMA